ncbi:MAG: hypothetical protein J6R04_00815 [Clostridia bacterium]|nr:hypothetical protein [Clostridia bacterium]
MSLINDLTGMQFGHLTVLYRTDDYVSKSGYKKIRWHCSCQCGKEIDVTSDLLRKGKTQSCGCLQSKLTSARSLEELTGQQFGRLTVISRADDYIEKNGGKRVRWRCLCECGNIKIVRAQTLKNGLTKSCGCLKKENTSLRCFKDIVGQHFGRWVVVKREQDYVSPSGYHRTQWLCKCSCGTERIVDASSLMGGRSISCGCYKAEITSKTTLIDIINKRFGRLVVLERVEDHITSGGRQIPRYLCNCDCGNLHTATSSSLLSGSVKSCGCLQQDVWKNPYNFNDLQGRKFGKWTVLERCDDALYRAGSRDTRWLCQCECGNYRSVLSNSLKNGKSLSCGCWKQSKLEMLVNQYLQSIGMILGMDYSQQSTYNDLVGINQGKLRFDFTIYEDGEILCFVECQGEQHYRPVKYFGGENKFEIQQYNDKMKVSYAENIGVPLIEIPYYANSYDEIVAILQSYGI